MNGALGQKNHGKLRRINVKQPSNIIMYGDINPANTQVTRTSDGYTSSIYWDTATQTYGSSGTVFSTSGSGGPTAANGMAHASRPGIRHIGANITPGSDPATAEGVANYVFVDGHATGLKADVLRYIQGNPPGITRMYWHWW